MTGDRNASLVHLGDTSFRRKDAIAGYREMLEVLAGFRSDDRPWDALTQWEFYGALRSAAPDIFGSGGRVSADDAAKRARTYTSALVKLGFADEQRRLTPLGAVFIGTDPAALDGFDARCSITAENSAVLRGALTYTETAHGDAYFPVRLLLRVLHRLGSVSIDEFALVFIAGARVFGPDVDAAVDGVLAMRASRSTLTAALGAAERTLEQDRFIVTGRFSPEAFPNGKGPSFTERYRVFLEALEAFRLRPDAASLARLRRAVDEGGTTVKNRFDPGQLLPGLRKKTSDPRTVHEGARYPQWHDEPPAFRHALVDLFNGGRTTALVREYLDNNLRILTATGVLSAAENQVRLSSAYARYFFGTVDDEMPVAATGEPSAAERVRGIAAMFGADALARTDARITATEAIAPTALQEFLEARDRERFDQLIAAAFGPDTVRAYLALIADDYRSDAVKAVREKAFRGKPTVPCMYEYLIGLSLYYASGKAFDPRAAFGLSLDGDFLPISHAPGLRGDIEFTLDGRRVLVEVTLMDPSTQRRGELEPVLRHATNLACEPPGGETLTLFIANEIDQNVARIFGFARVMEMRPTDGGAGTASPLIVSLRTADWVQIAHAPLSRVLDLVAAEARRDSLEHLNSDWNDQLVVALRALA
ncbi:AlwI family type II restriction endonuclease [Gordonia phosphorivorans]|uniref:AlwI family type II restriction endonuclease n=1 Tax=Gordonia phosphorivorans TaxID=1056982 RepID=A0ABV6HD35_9ACTN